MIFGYNGRDGVITDHNGLIYMRARYYAPELRRFLNADILKGQISDSTSLNRYSYVNGNPISFVDPFGLSSDIREDEDETINTKELLKLLKNTKKSNQSKTLSKMLNQIMKFKDQFTCSVGAEVSIPIPPSNSISYSTSYKPGDGNIELSAVFSDQLELLGSFSFPVSENDIVIDSDGSISIEYSHEVDEYTDIIVSISGDSTSFSANYTVKTVDAFNNYISTSLELEHKPSWNNPKLDSPELEPFFVMEYAPQPTITQLAGALLLAWVIGNDITGVGVADDALIPVGIGLLGLA